MRKSVIFLFHCYQYLSAYLLLCVKTVESSKRYQRRYRWWTRSRASSYFIVMSIIAFLLLHVEIRFWSSFRLAEQRPEKKKQRQQCRKRERERKKEEDEERERERERETIRAAIGSKPGPFFPSKILVSEKERERERETDDERWETERWGDPSSFPPQRDKRACFVFFFFVRSVLCSIAADVVVVVVVVVSFRPFFYYIYIYFFFTFAHSDRLRNQRNMKPKESHAPKRSAPEIVVIFFSSPVLLFYFFFFFCCFFIFVVISSSSSSSSSTCLPAALRLRLSNKVEDERVRDEYYGAATKKKEKKKGKKKNKNFVVGRNIFF